MRLLYDYQAFTLQKYGGISRYFYELIKSFNKNINIDVSTSVLMSRNFYISDKKDIYHMNLFKFGDKKVNRLSSILKLKQQNFDIFHPTYYNPYFLKYIKNKPFVLTVHDMIHEKFADMLSKNDHTSEYKKLLCNKANKIIAISQNTKKDLIEILGIKEEKIETVYHGNSLLLKANYNISDNKVFSKKYILFVGSRGSYKNFNKFIKGLYNILNQDKELLVMCVGGGKFNNEEKGLFNNLKIQEQVFQYTLNDNVLRAFYENAQLFVFPSLYEGFGIPILEAFASNCPVVCSNTSSLPEIAMNGAEYFDPYNEESIYSSIQYILNNNERKKELINNGKKRLEFFSWEKTTEDTLRLYENII